MKEQPCDNWAVSIHTLLAESDPDTTIKQGDAAVSIHTLLAESDSKIFQNTYMILDHFAQILHMYITISSILTQISTFFHKNIGANLPEILCSLGVRTY